MRSIKKTYRSLHVGFSSAILLPCLAQVLPIQMPFFIGRGRKIFRFLFLFSIYSVRFRATARLFWLPGVGWRIVSDVPSRPQSFKRNEVFSKESIVSPLTCRSLFKKPPLYSYGSDSMRHQVHVLALPLVGERE